MDFRQIYHRPNNLLMHNKQLNVLHFQMSLLATLTLVRTQVVMEWEQVNIQCRRLKRLMGRPVLMLETGLT